MNRLILFLLLAVSAGVNAAGVNSTNRFGTGGGANGITRFQDYPPAALAPGLNSVGRLPDFQAGSAPATPGGLMQSTDANGTTLTWTDNSANEDAFRVQCNYNGNGWFDVPFDVFSAEANPTAASDVSYFAAYGGGTDGSGGGIGGVQIDCSFNKFRVRAENAFGNSAWSTELQVTPSIMVGDLAALINVFTVEVQWTHTGEHDTGVQVYRSTNSGMSYSLLSTEAPLTATYTDTNVMMTHAAAVLRYYIVIVNEGGSGPNSNAEMPVP